MTTLLRLAFASAWNRRFTLLLTLTAIALSVTMLLGVERARVAARTGFAEAVSGTDLIVGARTSPVQLLLYSVFRLGDATNDMRWQSFEALRSRPEVAWAVPLALGDSHRGFPVVGTSGAYFTHFRYGDDQPLALQEGKPFDDLFDAVVGAEVARALGYRVDDRIVLSHGGGGGRLSEHGDKPFRIVGVLARTGTPVDRSVHVGLEAIEAIHLDWQAGAPIPGLKITPEQVRKFDIRPKTLTAVLVGLKSRAGVFRLQRAINEGRDEPLLAILPGVALDQLWSIMGVAESALLGIAWLVVATGLAGMIATVLAGLNERRRELSILRSVGAGPRDIVLLLAFEGALLTAAGIVVGYLLLTLATFTLGRWVQDLYGLVLPLVPDPAAEWRLLGAVLLAGIAASLLPAWRASRLALADGLIARV